MTGLHNESVFSNSQNNDQLPELPLRVKNKCLHFACQRAANTSQFFCLGTNYGVCHKMYDLLGENPF